MTLKFVPGGEKRPLLAIEAAENWVKGKATFEEVLAAANAARAAETAAGAAEAAVGAAEAAVGAARETTNKEMADLIREIIKF